MDLFSHQFTQDIDEDRPISPAIDIFSKQMTALYSAFKENIGDIPSLDEYDTPPPPNPEEFLQDNHNYYVMNMNIERNAEVDFIIGSFYENLGMNSIHPLQMQTNIEQCYLPQFKSGLKKEKMYQCHLCYSGFGRLHGTCNCFKQL